MKTFIYLFGILNALILILILFGLMNMGSITAFVTTTLGVLIFLVIVLGGIVMSTISLLRKSHRNMSVSFRVLRIIPIVNLAVVVLTIITFLLKS